MPKRYVVHDGVRLEHFRSGVAKQYVYTIWRGASASHGVLASAPS